MIYSVAIIFALLGLAAAELSHLDGGYDYPRHEDGYQYEQQAQDEGYRYSAPALQQTYLPPSQPQQLYSAPVELHQAYISPDPQPQQIYLAPALHSEQTYLPPTQPQQTLFTPSEDFGEDGYRYRAVKRYRLRSH